MNLVSKIFRVLNLSKRIPLPLIRIADLFSKILECATENLKILYKRLLGPLQINGRVRITGTGMFINITEICNQSA